jgi:UDP-glucose 4-epimerase
MSKQKILVTGGLGFISSHTVVELQLAGLDVVILHDLSNADIYVLNRIEKITNSKPAFYQIYMLDKKRLNDLFKPEKNIEAVIHFAAFKAVGESVKEPLKYFHNKLLSLIHLLECMEEFSVMNIVFSSSATVYGDPDELPATEMTPFKKALSSYGSTRQMGEEILEKTAAVKNINAISETEMINAFEKRNEIKLKFAIGMRRPGDAAAVYANATRAADLLNWKAELGLKEMVTSAWSWQKTLMKQHLIYKH